MFHITAAVGIDIGIEKIHAVLVEKHNSRLILKSLFSVSYQQNELNTALTDIKKKLIKTTKIPWFLISHQVLGIPFNRVVVKRFMIPKAPNDQAQYAQAGILLAENLGLPLDELLYDYRQVKGFDGIEVFACRRSQIEDKLNALEASGFNLSVIELETAALQRLFSLCLTQKAHFGAALLIHLGTERIQMCIDDGKGGQFQRELPLSVAEANFMDEQDKAGFSLQLVSHILRQYPLAAANLDQNRIKRLWLCGALSNKLDEALLAEKLGWQVNRLDLLASFANSLENLADLDCPIGTWSVAMGLALRDLQ